MPTADKKISDLAAKATPGPSDLLVIVDVADTSMAPSGTDRKTTVGGLILAQSQVAGLDAALAALQPAGAYLTALTGDMTASGPGSAAATLAPSGVTAGSYTNAGITVDAKGRITAAANGTGGGVAIGGAISGGTAGRVLLEGPGPVVADSANLTYSGGVLAVRADGTHHAQEWEDSSGAVRGWIGTTGEQLGLGPSAGFGYAGTGPALMLGTDGSDGGDRSGFSLNAGPTTFFFFTYRFGGTYLDTNDFIQVRGASGGSNWVQFSEFERMRVTPAAAGTGITIAGDIAQSAPLLKLQAKSSLPVDRDAGQIDAGFTDPTDATRTGWVAISSAGYGGTFEALRATNDGTQAILTLSGQVKVGTLSGLAKLTSGVVSAATEGTDYLSGASSKLPLPFSFGGSNANATGNDLCPRHHVSYADTVARLILSTNASVTGTFTVRVMRSADGGATFPDTIGTVSLAAGGRGATTTTIATPSLAAGDWLRCDITAVSGTVGSWMLRISTLSRNQ